MGLIGTVGAGREYTGHADSGVGRKLGALSISPAAHGAKIGAGPTGGPRYARISQATPFGCGPQSPSISPDRHGMVSSSGHSGGKGPTPQPRKGKKAGRAEEGRNLRTPSESDGGRRAREHSRNRVSVRRFPRLGRASPNL